MLVITPIYAGLVALLFLFLSYRVVLGRHLHKVSIGDAANPDMIKRMRVQANCAEYAPIALVLLVVAEVQGMPGAQLHVLGLMLVFGRLLHAYGLGSAPQVPKMRVWGMYLTVAMIAATALSNIGRAIL